jgi:predicted DNA repair protein MutK
MILEETTTIFCDGKQVAGIVFDLAASNRLRIIGVAAEKEVSLTVIAKAGSYL